MNGNTEYTLVSVEEIELHAVHVGFAQGIWEQTKDIALWLKAFVLENWKTMAKGIAAGCALSAVIYILSAVIILLLAPLIGPTGAVVVGCAVDVIGGGVALYALNKALQPKTSYGF